MGARWNWEAICEKGHEYGNFSGGADECYTCGANPKVVFDGDDASEQREAWKRECHAVADGGWPCKREANHSAPHRADRVVRVQTEGVEW